MVQVEKTGLAAAAEIRPDFIFNRFDLWGEPGEFEIFRVRDGEKSYVVEARYADGEARLGIWLMEIPAAAIRALAREIFSRHPEIKKIYYEQNKAACGLTKRAEHFAVPLPKTLEEFSHQSSKKSRYNLRRSAKQLAEAAGELSFVEYAAGTEEAVRLAERYRSLKSMTFAGAADWSAEEARRYFLSHNVDTVYALLAGGGGRCSASFFRRSVVSASSSKILPTTRITSISRRA